jgi:uncharacterized membrane protein
MPEIPDLTDASWQSRRSDLELRASILDGKGPAMPPAGGKIRADQARVLVDYVRTFAPVKKSSENRDRSSTADFEERFRHLQEEQDQLRKQFQELSAQPAHGGTPRPSQSPKNEEGGSTTAKKRSEAQSVPSGNIATMSPPRDITDPPGDELGSVSRDLASAQETSPERTPGNGDQDPDPPAAPEDAAAAEDAALKPMGFLEKLVAWLAKFHAASVHFPIGLLTAAAFAELLRLATGQPVFDVISRFCVWCGALGALLAGGLGWLLGGFHLTDGSWVMMTHRWLGTSTAGCAVLVLVLSEVSRRSVRASVRGCFRATVLVTAVVVSVTGFFGGAVAFGLDHYNWPQ